MASAKKAKNTELVGHTTRPVEWWPLERLRVNPRNARAHSRRQIRQILESIEAFGFVVPIIVDEEGVTGPN